MTSGVCYTYIYYKYSLYPFTSINTVKSISTINNLKRNTHLYCGISEFSSVGRAFDCSGYKLSNGRLFDSGNSERACHLSSMSGLMVKFSARYANADAPGSIPGSCIIVIYVGICFPYIFTLHI